ncbi:MAG: pyridine nucleotide-disulfide oxidoreductase [Gammaproteobacteria bacterium]|nr:pyridine nucleotide-disulfide oxidoreductase [Gammaproteobacteria bacterium]
MTRHVIIGAGQAGLQIVESLRKEGFSGEIALIGDEASAPYQRPPLSKKYLLGQITAERLLFRAPEHYGRLGVELRLSTRVTAIDPAAHTVTLAEGSQLEWDRLALATGARVRKLGVPGAEDPRVHVLRGVEDAEALRQGLEQAARVVVIGGGFIGLEVAAIARKLGLEVKVVEAQSRVLPRVVAPLVSTFFHELHTGHGVRILLDQQVAALVPSADALTVQTQDGTVIPADLVVVGIGVLPNTELAEAAGLACDAGIVVDEFARTSHPHIVSAGDCTRHRNLLFAAPHRLESVQNAVDQAKVAASTMLDAPVPYAQVPWFWSDQYDVKLQMVGISTGHDSLVVRGVPGPDGFSVFYRSGDRVIAVDSINKPAEHMAARKLIAAGGQCDPERLADTSTDLKTLLQ